MRRRGLQEGTGSGERGSRRNRTGIGEEVSSTHRSARMTSGPLTSMSSSRDSARRFTVVGGSERRRSARAVLLPASR